MLFDHHFKADTKNLNSISNSLSFFSIQMVLSNMVDCLLFSLKSLCFILFEFIISIKISDSIPFDLFIETPKLGRKSLNHIFTCAQLAAGKCFIFMSVIFKLKLIAAFNFNVIIHLALEETFKERVTKKYHSLTYHKSIKIMVRF